MHARAEWIFVTSCLAIIPLAGLMGKATEHLAERVGEGIGGLLNATFGNAAELIIAIMALRAGLYDVVKASITGSIIGNILLVFGLSALVGGAQVSDPDVQQDGGEPRHHDADAGGDRARRAGDLPLRRRRRARPTSREQELSLEIAVILMLTYVLSLVFTLKTHKHLYAGGHGGDEADEAHRNARAGRPASRCGAAGRDGIRRADERVPGRRRRRRRRRRSA